MNSDCYRLGGARDWFYVVEIYPGCRSCTAPPSISIRKIDRKSEERERFIDDRRRGQLPDLPPSHKYLNSTDHIITIAPDPDKFALNFVKLMKERNIVSLTKDEWRDIADAAWDDLIRGACRTLAKDAAY